MKRLRKILWRILGFDYQMMLNKTDYLLLKNDQYSTKVKVLMTTEPKSGDGQMLH